MRKGRVTVDPIRDDPAEIAARVPPADRLYPERLAESTARFLGEPLGDVVRATLGEGRTAEAEIGERS